MLVNKTKQVRSRLMLCWLGASVVHMVVSLQDRSGSVSSSLQMNLPMVKSGEGFVTGVASVGSEAGVDVAVDPPLYARLETLRAEITEEPLLFVSPHDVVVQLELALPTVGTRLLPVCRVLLVHPPYVRLEVRLTGENSLT